VAAMILILLFCVTAKTIFGKSPLIFFTNFIVDLFLDTV